MEKAPFLESLKFVKNTSQFIEDNYEKYGDFYKLSLPTDNIHVVISADLIQEMLVIKQKNYVKSKIYWGQLKQMVGKSLATIEGDEWLWLKRLQLQAFTPEKVNNYIEEVLEIATIHFDNWGKNKDPIDIIHEFSQMNISILTKVLFGIDGNSVKDKIANFIADGEEIISYRTKFPWRPFLAEINGRNRKYKSYLTFFNTFTEQVIKENKDSDKGKLIDLLIKESTVNTPEGKLSKERIRNEIVVHLGAGTETAAVGMGWAIYLLFKHPGFLKKVRKEIEDNIGQRSIRPDDVSKLTLTSWALKEALRLYPPSHALIRDAVNDDEINGEKIKKGDTFFFSTFGVHRNPRIWDNPTSYIPERFAKEKEFAKYSYIPFGAGRHTCIGRFLAEPMMILSLALFVQKFDFTMDIQEDVKPLSLSTLKPDRVLLTRLRKMIQ